MGTFETTGDVIEHARLFHRELGRYYHRLSDSVKQGRVRMLLDYLSKQETLLEDALSKYSRGGEQRIMTVWLQYTPELAKLEKIADMDLAPGMSIDEVARMALELDDSLVRLYRAVIENIDDEGVQEVFQNLVDQQQQEQAQLKKNATWLKHV